VPVPALRRLGIFGGTFDPVHIAHLQAALEAHFALALDRTLLVVAPDPWQKGERALAPAEVRYEMVAAALADLPGLEASRVELDRDGPTYTIDTVEVLRARHPDVDLFLVVGADVASNMETWHRAPELRELVTLAVVTRHGNARVAPDGWRVEHVAMPRLDVSSTDVRERVARGRPVEVLVPGGALRVLRAHALYTRP
jgi:nicotinate-nucleotide adenylyltransferase